jgi:hypothetical protein
MEPTQEAEAKKTDNWAEMSDDNEEAEQEARAENEKNEAIKEAKKKIPATQKGIKNKQGDYVVTTIDIPDIRTGFKNVVDGEEVDSSDTDTEYDEEDDTKEAPKEEEKVEGK